MGKLILICGSNGSGKSRYAESLISRTTGERYYIATMQPQTQENRRRIEKHRLQREGLHFHTLELPWKIADATVSPTSVVLLEDVSNLLGNILFAKGGSKEEALGEILALKERCRLLVAVSISGLCPDGYDGETASYIHGLNHLNKRLAELADVVVTMEDGQPVCEKGDTYALL